MKILISAYSSNPYLGSEDWFTWSALRCLAQDHELHVITSGRNRESLTQAATENLIPPDVHFHFAGQVSCWHPNRLRARFQVWNEYISFSKDILPVARELHQQEKFDLAHHLTAASWRVPSPLWQLDIPFVFGPIGGYKKFPLRFLSGLSFSAVIFELLRMASNLVSRNSSAVQKCLRRVAHVFTANIETEQLVKNLRGSERSISRLQPGFYSAARQKS